ncbi:hypothetical protein HZB02_05665 [Candidatus Woesearchaeota archaeon]|nr:hypothetical protein [Candidatus Woesearchaeota archaeon]
MSSTKIPGWAYLFVGLVVLFVSLYLNYQKMLVFILFGIVFIALGLGKIIFAKRKAPPNPQKPAKYCHFCGQLLAAQAQFCSRCGQQSIVKSSAHPALR